MFSDLPAHAVGLDPRRARSNIERGRNSRRS